MDVSFVTFEQAQILKDLGFHENVNHYYNYGVFTSASEKFEDEVYFNELYIVDAESLAEDYNNVYHSFHSAPTLAEAIQWIYNKEHIYIYAFPGIFDADDENPWYNPSVVDVEDGHEDIYINDHNRYHSPDEAISAGLSAVLTILQEKYNV